jgi:hypothetical protein
MYAGECKSVRAPVSLVQTVLMRRQDSATEDWPGTMAVRAYLDSDEGKAAVRHAASRQRLSRSLEDDLRTKVEDEALKLDLTGEPIRSPGGFVKSVLAKRAIDLVRGEITARRRFHRPATVDGIEGPEAGASILLVDELGFDAFESDDCLRSVRGSVADPRLIAHPWERSAVANYVAIRAELRMPGARCPQPRGGTSKHHAAEWAALWYAGRRTCFAIDGNDDSPAIRQARARCMKALDGLLVRLRDQMEIDNG